ncbi:uncharacterized protein F5147DRAFT_657142 [Suillus discolor]|uniref:Uncharacterized protein n=1 Tax=Suillus discolor TaxID=1912936 RepID=A0A9P7EY46_9AGAM|nr:uncharacterized protein F5147DRAFT_657142 [Suillus discolor]KAG2094670.1 hypothetical protein F5147DRAFT_657142 [Suillus discolor]
MDAPASSEIIQRPRTSNILHAPLVRKQLLRALFVLVVHVSYVEAANGRHSSSNEVDQCREPEDIQTTLDTDLFDDEADSNMSEDLVEAHLGQLTETSVMDVDKRKREDGQGNQVVCLIMQIEVGDKFILRAHPAIGKVLLSRS